MISFDFTFNSSDPTHWLLLVLVAVLPLIIGLLLWRNQTLTPRRKGLRAGLNLLLWLVLVAYLLQPIWKRPVDASQALLVAAEVPTAMARQFEDSLGLGERFGAEEFLKKKLISHFDSITLLGQDFPPALLAQLSPVAVRWLPYHGPDQLQSLQWQGIVRQGEPQRIHGLLQSSRKQWLKVTYAGQTLDSTQLDAGSQSFSLRFPAFAEGRTTTQLMLGDEALDTLRFFTRPLPTLSYQFVLSSPDFESRTLAEWLGKKGNPVTITTTISRGIQSSTTLNGGVPKNALPDVIITDPSSAGLATVKKALSAGKSVLFINLTQPEAELGSVNRILGTRFAARRKSTEATVLVAPNLTAQPYAFAESLPQQMTPGYPVAIWNKRGKIGVSLLNETFPLKLSGDSTAYASLWNTVLAYLQPPLATTITAEAPLFKGLSGTLQLNTTARLPARLSIGADTVTLLPAPLNEQATEVGYLFGSRGWVALGDSVEVYIEDSTSALFAGQRMNDYVRAQRTAGYTASSKGSKAGREAKLPEWVWLLLFCVVCAALWVEPKL
ncbi:MAG: hypothetical protein KKG00_10640 [Bacteroidetes bacterium]|nr:hypothetical protein [Bacteroidota bacterium]